MVIQVKSVRLELDLDLRKLERAENMIVSDPEIMRGTPVYRGTRIPVELIADMLSQGRNQRRFSMATLLWIERRSSSLRFTSKPSRGEAVRLLARGQNENRFVQPGIVVPLRGDSEAFDR